MMTMTGRGGWEGIIQSCKDNGEEENNAVVIQIGDGLPIQVEEEQNEKCILDPDQKDKDDNDTTITTATHEAMLQTIHQWIKINCKP